VPRERSDARGLVRVCRSTPCPRDATSQQAYRDATTQVCCCWPHTVCDTQCHYVPRGRYSRSACHGGRYLMSHTACGHTIAYRNGLRCRMLRYRYSYPRAYARVGSIPIARSIPDICLPIARQHTGVWHRWHTRTSPRASLRSLGTPRLAVCSPDAYTLVCYASVVNCRGRLRR